MTETTPAPTRLPLLLDRVTKRYGQHTAVDDLDITVGAGERVAVLGRNGAGKSTLLRLALGLSRPTSGHCYLFERPPGDHRARRRVGYVPQASAAPDRLRVREIIRFVRDCKGAAEPVELIERLDLGPLTNSLVGGLSLGQHRRLTLLLAFLGEPELLVLDEPTVSLDGQSRLAVWDLVNEYCAAGGTLLLASHDFREVSALTERVLVLVGGRLRADSEVTQLARTTGVTALEVPRTTDLPLTDVSFVSHQADRTVLITRTPESVVRRLTTVVDGPVVQRRPTVEEVCLALGGGSR
ncbi:ABC transporter ATP-binding protein [Streptomyces sp. DSM 44915]|uniref:ABC transporter ATP-binding protein n=1 Tax=Streptomyces chisholmiae TaxID=3075540 RepID=A0ABU2JNE9_9ACTN|nr:ABC transporter ATP-binding protein [Streptomyces sp. DSM 44915]MDT0266506.1 ABC transporter ATP-binding protein [Streptomyces sp. DSM 44915]